jgi:hypothetical protein
MYVANLLILQTRPDVHLKRFGGGKNAGAHSIS